MATTTRRHTPLATAIQIAHRFHLSYQTVNYYTNLGLLVTARKRGNHRLYHERQTANRLKRIESLKHEGYPLKLISRVLQSPDGRALSAGLPASGDRRGQAGEDRRRV